MSYGLPRKYFSTAGLSLGGWTPLEWCGDRNLWTLLMINSWLLLWTLLTVSWTNISGGGVYTSRHLMSVGDNEPSPHISLASYLFNIIFSLLMFMFMLLRGNPKCTKDPKISQCFRSQMNKAQRKIDRVSFICRHANLPALAGVPA